MIEKTTNPNELLILLTIGAEEEVINNLKNTIHTREYTSIICKKIYDIKDAIITLITAEFSSEYNHSLMVIMSCIETLMSHCRTYKLYGTLAVYLRIYGLALNLYCGEDVCSKEDI